MDGDAKTEIRKLRKKLREIERLSKVENRTLNSEEAEKISKKAEYEERLHQFEALAPAAEEDATNEEPSEPQSEGPAAKTPKLLPNVPPWAHFKFDFSKFSGHGEGITSLVASQYQMVNTSRFVSTSSDTTARLWQFSPKTVEDVTAESAQVTVFSGHSSVVTMAIIVDGHRWFSSDFLATLLPDDSLTDNEPFTFLLTSSLDCKVCIWSLETGKQLFSVYTYQPITQMAVVDLDLVMTGTESGKLELWNLRQKETTYSTLFDKNNKEIGWITRADDTGHIVACSRDDFLAVFEITSDPLVGAMVHQCHSSEDLKTTRGEAYVLRKVTAVVAHDSRIYLTTLHRPTIKSIGWDRGSLVVSRFAGRHFENGSFLSLNIWTPSEDDSSFLFAVEASSNNTPGQFAIHVHSLPHKSYALSNYYLGSIVVPFDLGSSLMPGFFNLSVGTMKIENQCDSEDQTSAKLSPCIFCSANESFLAFSPSVYPVTVSSNQTSDNNESNEDEVLFGFTQLELHPKPSIINRSLTMQSDFGDMSDERSDRLTNEAEAEPSKKPASNSKSPVAKNNAVRLPSANNENDSNPPTDVEDEDDAGKAEKLPEQPLNWGTWTKMCSVL